MLVKDLHSVNRFQLFQPNSNGAACPNKFVFDRDNRAIFLSSSFRFRSLCYRDFPYTAGNFILINNITSL